MEKTANFKVGDKVRVVGSHFKFRIGDEIVITEIDWDGDLFVGTTCISPDKVRLVSDKPTKNQRIKSLEETVEQLKARVEQLGALVETEKPKSALSGEGTLYFDGKQIANVTGISAEVRTPKPLTPNQQRKAIIAEAKAFLADNKTDTWRGPNYVVNNEGKSSKYGRIVDAEFIVNAEKRSVTVLLRWRPGAQARVVSKGIAKCAPDDVFNADIGKAIALGRALGLDVSKFEQAVKPSEVVVGHKIRWASGSIYDITSVKGKDYGFYSYPTSSVIGPLNYPKIEDACEIIEDTEAQY